MNEPLGLYLHIPFCLSKCRYCDFFSGLAGEAEKKDYVSALEKRIRALGREDGVRPFTSVYFGGGTPTSVGVDGLCRLLEAVRSVGLAEGAEVSFEANPATVDGAGLSLLRRTGFNRVSFGVQSFVPRELSALGRIHSAAEAAETVRAAGEAGFENVSLDLMLGIPHQTKESALFSVGEAVSLGVSHVSAYCLKLEPGTKMYAQYPDGKGLPSEDEVADIYLSVVSALEEEGLGQYEISNFAREGFACRHNLLYWQLGEYIGLGPTAHSLFKGQRFEFPPRRELSGDFGSVFEEAIPEDTDPETEYTMLSLRTSGGISSQKLTKTAAAKFENYVRAGFARRTEEGYALTPRGFLVSTQIISDILF